MLKKIHSTHNATGPGVNCETSIGENGRVLATDQLATLD